MDPLLLGALRAQLDQTNAALKHSKDENSRLLTSLAFRETELARYAAASGKRTTAYHVSSLLCLLFVDAFIPHIYHFLVVPSVTAWPFIHSCFYSDSHVDAWAALHCNTLQFTLLHFTVLYYTTLHYTTLHYTTLHYTTLHYTTLHYTTLQYTTVHYTTLHYTTLHYTTLHYTTQYYTTLHNTTHLSSEIHYTTLHYTTLHYTTLDYTTLHNTILYHTTLHYTSLFWNTLHYLTLHHCAAPHTAADDGRNDMTLSVSKDRMAQLSASEAANRRVVGQLNSQVCKGKEWMVHLY